MTIQQGTKITDGTTQFIVDDITDGIPVGDVVYRPYLKDGYLACNGQEVNRSDYPRLVELADKYSLWTSNQTNEPWKFGQGNGSTTMTMPNYKDRVIQGGETAGKLEAGLPNITGGFRGIYTNGSVDTTFYGAISSGEAGGVFLGNAASANFVDCAVAFNARLSSVVYGNSTTVQPPAIVLIPQMKY